MIRLLRRLLDRLFPLAPLRMMVGGEIAEVIPVRVVGPLLQVRAGSRLLTLGESAAADRAIFWEHWQRLQRGQPPIYWETGRRFRPPV